MCDSAPFIPAQGKWKEEQRAFKLLQAQAAADRAERAAALLAVTSLPVIVALEVVQVLACASP
jgi:hypothetical protein